MTNADDRDRETLQKILDATTSHVLDDDDEPVVPTDAREYRDIPALLSSLRSALQVPDAAQARRETAEEIAQEMDATRPRGWQGLTLNHCLGIARRIAAQPAALGEKEHEQPEAASDNGSRTSPVLATKPPPAPHPLDDAAVLERAIAISERESILTDDTHELLQENADRLRQTPAPDVFTSFGAFSFESTSTSIAEDAREWFGPLVDALERIRWRNTDASGAALIAGQALAQLRARVGKEASK